MLDYELIGKTKLGGEIYYLYSDNPFDIPAIRIFVSSRFRPVKDDKLKGIDILDFIDYTNKDKYDPKSYVRRILGYFHGDIGEMGTDGYYFKNISRLAAFLTWIPIGANRGVQGVGTERSLRYLSAKSFVLNRKLEEELFEDYKYLRKSGVKKEDARDVLPLSTSTELILQIPVGRNVDKWANTMIKNHGYLKEMKEIAEAVKKHNRDISGFESPIDEVVESRFSLHSKNSMMKDLTKKVDYKNKEFFYYDRITESVLAIWKAPVFSAHQDVRNRQVYHYWSSWEDVAKSSEFYHPLRLDDLDEVFTEAYEKAEDEIVRNWYSGNFEEAIYSIPLGAVINYGSSITGKENIKYTIALRSCLRAQFDIRSRYWRLMKYLERNGFEEKLGPRCTTEGRCFEPGKEKCPMYKRFVKNK